MFILTFSTTSSASQTREKKTTTMIARQVIFVFASLLFVFVTNISSAPIPDDQLTTKQTVTSATVTGEPINYDDAIDKSESNETSIEEDTTTIATIELATKDYPLIISHLLAFDVAEILNGTDPFPVESEMGLPATPINLTSFRDT